MPFTRLGEYYAKLKDEEYKLTIKTEVRKTKENTDAAAGRKTPAQKISKGELDDAGFALFEKLRELRLTLAKGQRVPPYIVFSDKALVDMCLRRPRTLDEMLEVSGVGGRVSLRSMGRSFWR